MYIVAYDLGTGGMKASVYDREMNIVEKSFIEYPTYYVGPAIHEQRISDWWRAFVGATRELLQKTGIAPGTISGIAVSGSSFVAIPIDGTGNALTDQIPIWSDTRAAGEARIFFGKVSPDRWYLTTGNGFPAPCYPLFKLMWLKKHFPNLYERTSFVLGSKDYINFRLTGRAATDFSYASGTGAFDLRRRAMCQDYLETAGLRGDIFLEPIPSHSVVGRITPQAAAETGLCEGTAVTCGGVDNACMALGAVGAQSGKAYVSLGSSSWLPVNSEEPILDVHTRPYVFAHVAENLYTSAFSIFAGGSSLRWVRETFCRDFPEKTAYQQMDRLAAQVPAGANSVFFNPTLAGGSSQDKSPYISGSFMGLRLGTGRADIIRAAMEGVCMSLNRSLAHLEEKIDLSADLLFCGGGSKSAVWMQMFADVFNRNVYSTNVDQAAASLGAAALAAVAVGWWNDYSRIPELHRCKRMYTPQKPAVDVYRQIFPVFERACDMAADWGNYFHEKGRNGVYDQQSL